MDLLPVSKLCGLARRYVVCAVGVWCVFPCCWFIIVPKLCACAGVDRSCCNTLQHTATHCNTLQHTAPHCRTLHHTAGHCTTWQHTATYCNTLQHTRTHCNTLHHTATRCTTLQHDATHGNTLQNAAPHCTTLHHTARNSVTLHHTAPRYNTLQHTATHCNTLQHTNMLQCTLHYTATHCNALQRAATHYITRRRRSIGSAIADLWIWWTGWMQIVPKWPWLVSKCLVSKCALAGARRCPRGPCRAMWRQVDTCTHTQTYTLTRTQGNAQGARAVLCGAPGRHILSLSHTHTHTRRYPWAPCRAMWRQVDMLTHSYTHIYTLTYTHGNAQGVHAVQYGVR